MFERLRVPSRRWKVIGGALALGFAGIACWLLVTEHDAVWPIRNTLQYHLFSRWWGVVGTPTYGEAGSLRGFVSDDHGNPLSAARVLVSRYDGTTYSARSDEQGSFRIPGVPSGTYRAVAGATGYESSVLGGFWSPAVVTPGAETVLNVQLSPLRQPQRPQPPGMSLEAAVEVNCEQPLPCQGSRRRVRLTAPNNGNQLVSYYTPLPQQEMGLPLLLCVYPGPADLWESVSLSFVAQDYAVIAVGPDYSFALETQVDDLECLLALAREGRFPGGDSTRVALVGGSYSSFHVERMLQRGAEVNAVLLMGPVADLFDMRRRLENGTFTPPYGLDAALRSLGFPDRQPLRYWRHSGMYHVRPDYPPIAILHSKSDEIVPYEQSEAFAKALQEAGVPHEVHFFEGGGHYLFAGDDAWREMYDIALRFLARHLKEPGVNNAPSPLACAERGCNPLATART